MKYDKVLLISPEYNYPYTGGMYPNGGLLSIGTVLRKMGCEVGIVHMIPDKRSPSFIKYLIMRYQPDIVGISVTTFQTKSTKAITKAIKEVNPETLVIIGGPHPSALGSGALNAFPLVDVAVLGEGEDIMKEMVEDKDWHDIKGICFEDVVTESRPFRDDLDSLPLPDLNLIKLKNFSSPAPSGASPSMSVMGSRGCPYHCEFCSKAVFGNVVRLRSPERVVDEVEMLHKRWGIREIFLHDDTFNLNREWAMAIFEMLIKRGLDKLKYKVPFRVDEKLVDNELLRLAKRAGVWLVFYGVESGNQDMLDRMGKGIDLDETRRAFRLTHEAGIKTTASFIVGFPGETNETLKQSWAFAKELNPFWVGFSRLTPFPWTTVERKVRLGGYLLDGNYDNYRPDKVLARTQELSEDEIEEWAVKLDKWAYNTKIKHLLANPVMAYRTMKGRR